MTVADRFRRNRKMTTTTSAKVRNSVYRTSASDARIDCERSERSWRSTEAGKNCLRLAMTVRTRPATSTVFAPGCRCTASTIARSPLNQAALLLSCTSSRTRSEEHTSELQSRENLVCRLLLEKKKKNKTLKQDQKIIPHDSSQYERTPPQ